MLSSTPIKAPRTLLARARGDSPARTLISGADSALALDSARMASEEGLIEPVLIGRAAVIAAEAEKLGWDIGGFDLHEAAGDQAIADKTAALAADPAARIVMKGAVHTDAMMAALLRSEARIRAGRRLTHIFHMTVPGEDRALMISDGALNIAPSVKARQAVIENLIALSHALEISRPKIAVLSASESVLAQMPTTLEAAALTEWAAGRNFEADIYGPLAFDIAVSPAAAALKGLGDNPVAGRADALVAPTIEVGNALFKIMVYFMSACAAGVVMGGRIPIIITSRADPAEARLASAALAVIAARI